jgi:hypothetical protein
MARMCRFLVVLLGSFWCAAGAVANIIEETIELPVQVGDAQGRTIQHSMKVHIYRDGQRATSPFLILNHGRSGQAAKRQALRAGPYAANARYLVERGFAVFLPIRIGYGATGGPDVENSGACGARMYAPAYEAAAQQSISVIEHAKSRPVRGFRSRTRPGAVVRRDDGDHPRGEKHSRRTGGGEFCRRWRGTPRHASGRAVRSRSHGEALRLLWCELAHSNPVALQRKRQVLGCNDTSDLAQGLHRPWWSWRVRTVASLHKTDGHPSFTGNRDAWRPAFEAFLEGCCEPQPPPTAKPNTTNGPEAYSQVLAAWSHKYGVKRAVMVVRRDGRIAHQAAIGGADLTVPVLLASLSKAITGACIATLVRDGKLGFDWPLSRALASFFRKNGRPPDARIERVTIAQLLTHRAGFSSAADGEDESTGSVLKSYLSSHSTREPPTPAYLSKVFESRLRHEPGQVYAYSNAGYLALGAVIEEATGQN